MTRKPQRVFFLRPAFSRTAPIKEKAKNIYKRVIIFCQKRPLTAFLILLVIFLLVLTAGRVLKKTPEARTEEPQVKKVSTFEIGAAPRINLDAIVEKSQVLEIVALTPGIVSKIHIKDGQEIKKGTTLVSLASNYQGGNAASVQRQITQVQFQNVKENFDLQKNIIAKLMGIAEKTDASSDELRDITSKSQDETKSLISLNENIISDIDKTLASLESTNVGGASDALILQTKQLKSQFLAGTNQAKQALRLAEFQASGEKPSAELSNLQKDLTIKQLNLQQSQLELNKRVSGLQTKLAQVQEAAMFPASPFASTVEKIHVKLGDSVNPGTPLVTISGTNNQISATVLVPQSVARSISKLDPTYIFVDDQKAEVEIANISQEATNNSLNAVVINIPADFANSVTEGSFVKIEIPIAAFGTDTPYIPLDSIHQTQEETITYIIESGQVVSRKVEVGNVRGNFIQITSGLMPSDQVIVDRNVTEGDLATSSSN